jgi:hypothetical protein
MIVSEGGKFHGTSTSQRSLQTLFDIRFFGNFRLASG